MKTIEPPFSPFAAFKGAVLSALVWTVLVLASLFIQREQLNRTSAELARIAAIANLKKDMAIRDWASKVGGVFIREKRALALDVLDQEQRFTVTKPSGERFGLIHVTPMHLLLAVQEMSTRESEFQERLTSRQLRNMDNAPDEWEREALAELEKGTEVVTEALPKRGGHGLMRVMIPMRMEKECLECHRDTLVPLGGLRGGASVSVDLNAFRAAQEPTWRTIQYWHGGIWLLGLAMIGALYYIFRRRARELLRQDQARCESERELAGHREHLEDLVCQLRDSQSRLRALARFLQDVRENERTSIARELHDELGQALTALRIDLGWLRKRCSGGDNHVGSAFGERIDGSRAMVERTIDALRNISEGLRPGMLDVLGLRAALEHFARKFEERHDIACTFHADRDEYDLNANQSIAVFRLVQEALTNVARHAQASHVDIRLDMTHEKLHLVVLDDGVGFDPQTAKKGFGLLGMTERVNMLGGEMNVDGRRGTRIAATLPLATPQNKTRNEGERP